MSLGTIIRGRREQKGLTQDQVVEQAGISKPYLSNIETGKTKNPPTDGVLAALEQALGFEAGELLRLAHLARTPADVRQEHELLEAQVQRLRSVLKQMLAEGSSPSGPAGVAGKAARGAALGSAAAKIFRESNVRAISAGVAVPVINKVAAGYPHHFTDLDYPTSIADEYVRCPDLHDPQAFAARVVGDSMQPKYREGDIVVFSPVTTAQSGDDCFVRFADDSSTTFKRIYQDDDQTVRLQPLNSVYPSEVYTREEINGLWPAVFRIERLGDR